MNLAMCKYQMFVCWVILNAFLLSADGVVFLLIEHFYVHTYNKQLVQHCFFMQANLGASLSSYAQSNI